MSKNFTKDLLESCEGFFEPILEFFRWVGMNPGAILVLTVTAIVSVGFMFNVSEKESSDKFYRKLAAEYCMEVHQSPVKTLVIHKFFSATTTCQDSERASFMVLDQYYQAKLANAGE